MLVLVFSEFGRRLTENASAGTDHGTAAPVFLLGQLVKAGRHGPYPNLQDLDEPHQCRAKGDLGDLYGNCSLRPVRWTPLHGGDTAGAHRALTAASGMAEHTDVAAAALQELRRVQPNISLAWIADEMPIMQGSELEHYLEAFGRAGLK